MKPASSMKERRVPFLQCLGYGTNLGVVVVHVLRIADTLQEGVVVFVLLGIVASLYYADITSNGFFPRFEVVVILFG